MNARTPDIEELVRFASGEMDDAATAEMRALLASNPQASRTVERLQATIQSMRQDDGTDLPAQLVQKLRSLLQPQREAGKVGLLESVDQFIARLVFDSRMKTAQAGLRGISAEYQLVYESEIGEVDVQMQPASDLHDSRWRIIGQLSADELPDAAPVALVQSGTVEPVVQTGADEFGVFSLDVPAGRYDLLVGTCHGTIVLSNLAMV